MSPRRSASSVPRHVRAWHVTPSHTTINHQQAVRPVSGSAPTPPASLPAANSPFLPHVPDPVSSPDRSSIAISVARFRYCRSWVICLMPSGPSWSRQSVYATWLETSSRAWTASSLNPIIIALAGGVAFKHPFSHICHDTWVPRLVVLRFHQVAAPAVGLSVQCSSAAATL